MVKNGALRLFRIAGVDVYIHWSWLVILYVLSSGMSTLYSSPVWIAIDIACYIGMVTLHEVVQLTTGRMVGGMVSEMYITFLGRNSNLDLPQRPWPIILTYSAGILAYVLMLAGTSALFYQTTWRGLGTHDTAILSGFLLFFNVILLIWVAVPAYPLDAGKVLQGFLWLFMSRKRSLQVTCIIGLPISIAAIVFSIYLAVTGYSYLLVLWTVLIFFQCLSGFRQAKAFDILEQIPRRTDVVCPHCRQNPFHNTALQCPCGKVIDPFDTRGLCPACGSSTAFIVCPVCRQRSPIYQWFGSAGGFDVQPASPAQPIQQQNLPTPPSNPIPNQAR